MTAWIALLMACNSASENDPTLAFLAPEESATVAVGAVTVSVVVENFEVAEPTGSNGRSRFDPTEWLPVPVARAHGDEEAQRGFVRLVLDGGAPFDLFSTQGTLESVTAGSHTLVGELIHEDGESLEPAVTAQVSFDAE